MCPGSKGRRSLGRDFARTLDSSAPAGVHPDPARHYRRTGRLVAAHQGPGGAQSLRHAGLSQSCCSGTSPFPHQSPIISPVNPTVQFNQFPPFPPLGHSVRRHGCANCINVFSVHRLFPSSSLFVFLLFYFLPCCCCCCCCCPLIRFCEADCISTRLSFKGWPVSLFLFCISPSVRPSSYCRDM